MPKQLDQLPSDPTSLARRVQALEREVREMRASRRMGTATVGRLRVYSADGQTLLAELGPTDDGGGGLQTLGVSAAGDEPLFASLTRGQLQFQPVDDTVSAVPARISYDVGSEGSDLLLNSGSVLSSDWEVMVDMSSVRGGGPAQLLISGARQGEDEVELGQCDTDVYGVLTAANIAYGQVSITPSAANTPTSTTVNGLGLLGSTFYGFAAASTVAPGTVVTGVSATGVTSDGLTVWATRTNTVLTLVNWLVIGI
jgi:hypothetical protein